MPSGIFILTGFLVIGLYVGAEAGFVSLNPSSEATTGARGPVQVAASSTLASELLDNQQPAETSGNDHGPPVASPTPPPVLALLTALTPTPVPSTATSPPTATPIPATATPVPPTATPVLEHRFR